MKELAGWSGLCICNLYRLLIARPREVRSREDNKQTHCHCEVLIFPGILIADSLHEEFLLKVNESAVSRLLMKRVCFENVSLIGLAFQGKENKHLLLRTYYRPAFGFHVFHLRPEFLPPFF